MFYIGKRLENVNRDIKTKEKFRIQRRDSNNSNRSIDKDIVFESSHLEGREMKSYSRACIRNK